ncbi:MAG: YraN family protein [Flavobacteriales bacterium]|nr:YraN family protein [Flavobacteriales bacterium]
MRTIRQRIGAWGEQEAEYYLRGKGYRNVARNYRIGKAEIDRIMDDGGTCVFVEVKTRSSDAYGLTETHFGKAQALLLLDAADKFLEEHPKIAEIRFDLVAITGHKGSFRLKHWQDVLSFPFELGL